MEHVLDIKATKRYDRITIDLEAPYSEIYNVGYVYIDKYRPKTKRAFVYMYREGDSSDCHSTLYSKYKYQIDYWKRTGKWIPEDMEVDHINNDPYDDRLCNLQLLTRIENIKKRDDFKYRSRPLNNAFVSRLEKLLSVGITRKEIIKKFKISYGYLRWIIHNHLTQFENATYAERNADDMIELIGKGVSAGEIGDLYGISRSTVLRIYEKNTGRKYTESNTKERVAFISEKIDAGHTLSQISRLMGVTDAAVLYLVKKYLPEKWKIMQKNYTDKAHYGSEYKLEKLAEIETYLDKGHSLTSASNLVGIKQQQASAWIAELRPDLKQKMRQTRAYRLTDEQKKNMVEDYVAGSTFSLLAVKYQVSTATVHKFCTEAGVVRAPRAA